MQNMQKEKNKNGELFDNIIGYDDIKEILRNVVDMVNNKEKYEKLGCELVHGLLLYGPPGTGKTSIANEILKNVNRKVFTIRKVKSDGEFIDYMSSIFDKAKDTQPSIILLDDLDKFSEVGNKANNEEYVVVQSLIDDIKNEDIFVVATANNIYSLPDSLKRSGRFDIQLEIDKPKKEDALKIFSHYLNTKKIDDDVNIKNIASILTNSSCADLEKVCNQAGVYAGFKNKQKIGMEELVRASLELKYKTNIENINLEDNYALNVAYHEAGHALIGELLEKSSVSFITIAKNNSDTRGITIFNENIDYHSDIKYMKNRVKSLLAGKAATEIVFNSCDVGTNSDLRKAYAIVRDFVESYCMIGFDSWIYNAYENSEKVKQAKDDKVCKIMTDYYNEVKVMLVQNRSTLDALATKLKDKKIMFQDEIQNICNLISN